ncbi:MAG: hypothetical protein LBT84_01835 [Spirochaetia bacterium]|jgi:hypothetical protein|nr:hypothetical protein [Spirochaetia bacterium]
MIPSDVQMRLQAIQNDFFQRFSQSDNEANEITLTETEKNTGSSPATKCCVTITGSNNAIVFHSLDRCKFNWLIQPKCADHIIMEHINCGWILHIFELKNSVKKDTWFNIYEQFKGAYLRAEAIAGFLHITFNKVKVYICYQLDKFSESSLAAIRASLNNEKKREILDYWEKNELHLDCFEGKNKVRCEKIKIQLDQNGNGCSNL